ncbi:restriction endonuclease [Pseudomonas sp. MBLB4136]|uniref:restriction endonuclease n=1 Tax=Pseudomonas sp. MBLB4136 TaxID=3451558 RepID=UPI003F75539C
MHYFDDEKFAQYILGESGIFTPDSARIVQLWNEISEECMELYGIYSVSQIDHEDYEGFEYMLAHYEEYRHYESHDECSADFDCNLYNDPRFDIANKFKCLIDSINEAASSFQLDLRVSRSDSPEKISSHIIEITKTLIEKDELFNQENLSQVLDDYCMDNYTSICKSLNGNTSSCGLKGILAAQDFSRFIAGLYEELGRLSPFLEFLIRHKESILNFFNGRNVRLVTGELDWAKIRKLLKKDFAYQGQVEHLLFERFIYSKNSSTPTLPSTTSKGQDLEVSISRLYESLGYRVTLTKTSGDFGVDIIAESNSETIAIQCKNYESLVGVDAIMQAYSGGRFHDCSRYCVVTTSGFTEPAREMADKLGVEVLIYSGTR